MSLRARLILSIGLVLLASLIFGGVLAYWHAERKVDVEMRAAIEVGQRTFVNAVDDLRDPATASQQLALLIENLNGDRHLRATLIGQDGSVISSSTPLKPEDAAPEWFYRLLDYRPEIAHIFLPSRFGRDESLDLETDSHNEIAEAWSDVTLMLAVLALFCLLDAGLVYYTVGRALRPLDDIVAAFGHVGDGHYTLHVPEDGPHELAQLGRGFNHMTQRLADMALRQHRLEEQLVDVQEEERAEIARDLHDEIGPLLFAVNVDLAAIEQHEGLRRDPQFRARLDATREAVSLVQHHVKAMLGHLRPSRVEDLGLASSIERLVAFWRTRYARVLFEVDIPEGSFTGPISAGIYRIVQESISNALRHGNPSLIEVKVSRDREGSTLVEVCDDGTGLQLDRIISGLGLTGMRERVSALGGELKVTAGTAARGVKVFARLPAPSQEADATAETAIPTHEATDRR